jgi:hypothetical protein
VRVEFPKSLNWTRREFIITSAGVAIAATLPLPAVDAGRMLRTFRELRASREGLFPDIAVHRMTRTIDDLRAANIEIGRIEVETRREIPGNWRPPVGFVAHTRCNWHEWAFAGPQLRRKLRCLICETEELHPDWIRNPFLLRSGFYRVAYLAPPRDGNTG